MTKAPPGPHPVRGRRTPAYSAELNPARPARRRNRSTARGSGRTSDNRTRRPGVGACG